MKAIEWSDVAKKNRADTQKSIACFGQYSYDFCEKEGEAFFKNQMRLNFFATNSGKQTNLIVTLADKDNQFIKTSIYIDLQGMDRMLNAVKQIENSFQKARKTAKDRELFK